MEWEGFLEGYRKVEEFSVQRQKLLEELRKRKKELREEVQRITPIRKAKEGGYLSVAAVDSSFGELFGDDWGGRLYAVCVAGASFVPRENSLEKEEKEPEFLLDECSLNYEEEDDFSRVLKGLAIAKEIEKAKEWFSERDLVVVDGSAKSVVISINQGMTVGGLERSKMGRELRAMYRDTLWALYELLNSGRLVFNPKRSGEVLLADKVSSMPFESDFALLSAVLEEGEYVALRVPPQRYNLPKEGVEELLPKLFDLLNHLRVIYFKAPSGQVKKLETRQPSPVSAIEGFFILEGESLLTHYADGLANFYFTKYKEYARKINPWRYRL
uniref:DNA double-strand break repair nuclease NurA n=1 Tax=Thermocrinis ruber TaxID=75906 RepID=A0A7C5T1R1_9AQUI